MFFFSPSYHLLGDSAFPLQEYLLVPYKDYGTLSAQQIHFNKRHSKTRTVFEYSFGILKSRFRILNRVNTYLKFVPDFITACCILHNICVSMNDEIEFYEEADQNASVSGNDCTHVSRKTALHKRDQIARKLLQIES